MIVDFHCDALMNLKDDDYKFNEENPEYQVDLPKLKRGNIDIQTFAVFVEPEYKPHAPLKRTIQITDKFFKLIEKYEDLGIAKNYKDIKNNLKKSKISALLSLEGADGVYDLSILRILYRLGFRIITLTWNQRNHIADGIGEAVANGGITNFGKDMINEMNNLGILIDVSHICERSFWDVIDNTEDPIVASHSNSRFICDNKRNLTDEQIKALAENGGVIGVNFCPSFLSKNDDPGYEDIAKHIEHVIGLVGSDHLGLGSDFDGIKDTPNNLENVGKIPDLLDFLKKRGTLNSKEMEKFKGQNWLRLVKNVF